MYLGYAQWGYDKNGINLVNFIVCLEGTQADILRVKKTSTYFAQDTFIMATKSQLKNEYFCKRYFNYPKVRIIKKLVG